MSLDAFQYDTSNTITTQPSLVRYARSLWLDTASGVPLEFPVMSLGEFNLRPTSMLFRNLMSMDVEESITANPLDGVVLLGGCDKTTPALLMGAASADVPAFLVTGGPQLSAHWRGETLGSCTDCRRYEAEFRHHEHCEFYCND